MLLDLLQTVAGHLLRYEPSHGFAVVCIHARRCRVRSVSSSHCYDVLNGENSPFVPAI